ATQKNSIAKDCDETKGRAIAIKGNGAIVVFAPVAITCVITHDIVAPWQSGSIVIVQPVTGPIIAVANVELQYRIGYPAVQVKTTTVHSTCGTIVERDITLDQNSPGFVSPNANRPSGCVAEPPIVVGNRAFDTSTIDVA